MKTAQRDYNPPRKLRETELHVNVPLLRGDGSVPIQIPVTSPASSFKIGDVAGGHYTEFLQNGTIRYHGNARPWRDEIGDILQIQKNGVGITTNIAEGTIDFDYNAVYHATATLADMLYKNVQLNHDKDLSVSVSPHLHWFQAKNYAPHFMYGYRWHINGGAKVTPWTLVKANNLAFTYVSGTIHQISYCTPIAAPVGSTLSDIIQIRIYRDTGNASGLFTGNCPYNTGGNASTQLLSFDTHFMIDSHGSDEELVK
jgi:hypothetical protein